MVSVKKIYIYFSALLLGGAKKILFSMSNQFGTGKEQNKLFECWPQTAGVHLSLRHSPYPYTHTHTHVHI